VGRHTERPFSCGTVCKITIPDPGTYAYHKIKIGYLATFIENNSRRHRIDDNSYFVLERHQINLGTTREVIGLPIDHPDNLRSLSVQVDPKKGSDP
jgi:hypothetical protein